MSMRQYAPEELSDLFEVFERLERGESVLLMAKGDADAQYNSSSETGEPKLGVWSSGTSGNRKLRWHPWERLLREVRYSVRGAGSQMSGGVPHRWCSCFEPWTYAGVQVALQAWATGGSILSLSNNWNKNWLRIWSERPDAISATPSFLALLAQSERGRGERWQPRQVTVGGEPLRRAVADRLRRRFSTARLTAVYASTELGVLLKSHRWDGWYPATALARRAEDWRVNRGVLWVRQDDRWVSTGDLIERTGDWFRIIGRADAVANVGGVKVRLDCVAERAMEVSGVRLAVGFAAPSSVLGEVVGLRFGVEDGCQEGAVREALEVHLRSTLMKEAWPRRWEIGDGVLGANGKCVMAQ